MDWRDIFGHRPLVKLEGNWHPTVCDQCADQRHSRCETETMRVPCDCAASGHRLVGLVVERICPSVITIPVNPDQPPHISEDGDVVQMTPNPGTIHYEVRCGLTRGHGHTYYQGMLDKMMRQQMVYGNGLAEIGSAEDSRNFHVYHDPMGRTIRWPNEMGTERKINAEEVLMILENEDAHD